MPTYPKLPSHNSFSSHWSVGSASGRASPLLHLVVSISVAVCHLESLLLSCLWVTAHPWGCSFSIRSLEVFLVVHLPLLTSYHWNKFPRLPWGSRPTSSGVCSNFLSKLTPPPWPGRPLSWSIVETWGVLRGNPWLLLSHPPSQRPLKCLV